MVDFEEQLKHQITFLENSIQLFETCEIEAIRIATTIRVCVHDTSNSTSLLKHLNAKTSTDYLDTTPPRDAIAHFNISGPLKGAIAHSNISGPNVEINQDFVSNAPYAGLVAKYITRDDNGVILKFKPIFNNRPEPNNFPKVSFETWWNGEVYDNKNGKILTREKLVLAAANKDGGAHVDSRIPPNYEAIKNENYVAISVDGIAESFTNVPLYSSLCQVGWELLNTLKSRV